MGEDKRFDLLLLSVDRSKDVAIATNLGVKSARLAYPAFIHRTVRVPTRIGMSQRRYQKIKWR